MIELNKDKIQLKYITGLNKTLFNYPTALDVLYDACKMSVDDTLFSRAKITNMYFSTIGDNDVINQRIDDIITELVESGFVEKSGHSYKIIKTIWE